ncbi:leucine rich repeat containing 24 [Chamberlinius hualienensis]
MLVALQHSENVISSITVTFTMPHQVAGTTLLLLISSLAVVTLQQHQGGGMEQRDDNVSNRATSTESMATSCPSVCFCDETHYVSCVGDGLWEVPGELPTTVTRLELRNYIMETLPAHGLLASLLHLVEIKLQQTQISIIENATFSNLTRLLRLDVSENLLERVSSATFEGLTSLRYLDLSSNRLNDVDEAFVDLVNLEQLNLRDNSLPQLTSHTFFGLYKLQYLNLDSNNISAIEVGTFQYMTNLAHLIVSNNPLTTLSRLDFFGSRLQYIDVSCVQLQRVPQSLTRYVRDLRLAKNNLTHIRLGDFDSYPYLSLLVLDDNCIVEIESDALGRLEFLLRLWLNGNRLSRIPANLPPTLRVLYVEENAIPQLTNDSLQGLFNLEQLFLKRNHIRFIASGTFSDLVSLTHLDLQANLIEIIQDGTFANLTSLISLDLSQNPLHTIMTGCFVGLDNLKTLVLSRMKVSKLVRFDGSAFDPLKHLESLEMYDSPVLTNYLVNSTRSLQSLRNLRQINLMHNNLAALRQDFPHFFPQLKVAKLSGNAWNCQRNILWLTNWITKSDTHFYHSFSIRCSKPDKLLHKPLAMLKDEDFEPQTKTTLSSPPKLITKISVQPTTKTTPSFLINYTKSISKVTNPIDNGSSTKHTTTIPINVTTTSVTHATSHQVKLVTPIIVTSTLSSTTAQLATIYQVTTDSTVTSITPPTTTTSVSIANDLATTAYNVSDWILNATSEMADNLTTSTNETLETNDAFMNLSVTTPSDVFINITSINGSSNIDESLVAAITLSTGLGLVFLGVTTSFFIFRWRKNQGTLPRLDCIIRRSSSSISYSPHRDEVSIVTVSDGTVGLTTLTHQGLSNKLYFVLENGNDPNSRDQLTKAALPDPSLAELLPSENQGAPTAVIKTTNTYCFT